MTVGEFSVLDLDSLSATVDFWESPGIVSAAEASEAKRRAGELKRKLESEENNHTRRVKSVRGQMEEMEALLAKVEPSSKETSDMARLAKLDEELKLAKESLLASKAEITTHRRDLIKSLSVSKTFELRKVKKEKYIAISVRLHMEAERVDLAFLLDCTGSMKRHIDACKSSMKDVVRRVSRTNAGLNLRVAVVGYRDLRDDKRFEILEFTSSVDKFEHFVSALSATGGDDKAEDMAGAVNKANELDWQQASRVTFLIADDPCHGTKYHTRSDDYPEGTPGICIETELKKLMDKGGHAGMQLLFGRITSHTDPLIGVLTDKGFNFDVCDIKDASNLSSEVVSSVRKSISHTLSASRSKSKSSSHGDRDVDKDLETSPESTLYKICKEKPTKADWESFVAHPARVLCNKPITSISDLQAPLSFGVARIGKPASSETEEFKVLLRRAKDPFAKGQSRLAYYGKIVRPTAASEGHIALPISIASMLVSEEGGPKESGKDEIVLKSFMKPGKLGRENCLAQMEVSSISNFLADEYNRTCRPPHCAEIRFLKVFVVESNGPPEERFCAEALLPDDAAASFTRYSNNNGYWNEKVINQSLLLFTKFTYFFTRGYLMVTDLQGAHCNGNQFVLTDPAILCKDITRFGSNNLGRGHIDRCLKSTNAMLEEYGWDD